MDDRQVDIAGESLVEHVYADSLETDSAAGSDVRNRPSGDLPNTERDDGNIVAVTDEGRQVYLDREDEDSGTEGSFFADYADRDHTEQFGYYCANCGSLDTSMDNVGRIECTDCSNTHAERSDEAYDDSYL